MGQVRNILFIMCDQLRADYLSCAGHPSLQTPHIDGLAGRGVSFSRAYCQSPMCGPSRMSFYTGRYMTTHGATWNGVPLRVDEWTLGDYLRPLGLRVALAGKTHMAADGVGMARLEVNPHSERGTLIAECGFEPFDRDDGLRPGIGEPEEHAYERFLRAQGYTGDNLWHDVANSAERSDGKILSGWQMRYADMPARVKEEHSETAYMTDRALDFIEEAGDEPWCLHLSYIKPHWPYVAPAPYHKIYSVDDVLPANRDAAERIDPHPVYGAFLNHEDSVNFQRDEVRERVIPAYMGLVKQIDDHIGRLLAALEEAGRLDDTLIVFTSDHGDYLGDHWLAEKELFHEESVRIPLIVADPDPAANWTRGNIEDRLVEAIDLLPTFVDALGGQAQPHRLEGRSLLPLIRGRSAPEWRNAVISETDYAFRQARLDLEVAPEAARGWMLCTERWKYVHWEGFRPQLFDLENDPKELRDLGGDPAFVDVRIDLNEDLFDWLRGRRTRVTISDEEVARRTAGSKKRGYLFGEW